MNRVQEAIGASIPVRAIFMNPTIAALAEEIDRNIQADEGVEETNAADRVISIFQ